MIYRYGDEMMKESRMGMIRKNRIKHHKTRTVVMSVVLVLIFSTFTFLGVRAFLQALPGSTEIAAIDTHVGKPPADQPLPEQILAVETPVVEMPAVETPVVETPVNETPAVETPAVETSVEEAARPETPAEPLPVVETPPVPQEINPDALLKGSNHSIRASEYAYDVDEIKGWMKGTVPYTGQKIAFLTFDDGPTKHTAKILDILKERGVPATFFILGKSLANYNDKSIMNRYITEGHAIGNHSYSHVYDYLYPGKVASADRILQEFNKTLKVMKGILGEGFNTKVFRFPGGSMSWKNADPAKSDLKAMGVKYIDWNCMSGDAEPKSRRPIGNEAIASYVMKTLANNRHPEIAIVLMHDSSALTPEYIGTVIDRLKAEGYHFGIME